MFNKRNNLRRSVKHKQPKNTKKTPQYVEDYNEVILNDLVDENKVDEAKVEEETVRKPKKNKGINLSFGGKKKSTSTESNKKTKPSDKKNKKDEPEEIIEVDNKKETGKTQQNSKPKESNSKQKKAQSKKNSKKKSQNKPQEEGIKKNHHKLSKKQSAENKEENHKKHNKRRVKKEEKVIVNSVEDENIKNEKINEEFEEREETTDLGAFRNINGKEIENNDTQDIENDMAKEENEYKLDNIIWSDDSFPKN